MSENKIKIALIGSGGRMGKAITGVLSASNRSVLYAAVERSDSPLIGQDSGMNAAVGQNGVPYSSDMEAGIKGCDVIIDFGVPEGSKKVLEYAVQYKKPVVIGVTGLDADFLEKIRVASLSIPILRSPNMSVGVNLLFKLVEIAARVLQDDYDIEILDIHHKHKKDSPSGTANELKEILLRTLQREEKDVIFGRKGFYSSRDSKEIAIHSMRAGEVVGDHTVYFFSPDERVEITHKARDRRTFAVGSVKAAEFLFEQKLGLYSMLDVLGI